MTFYVIILVIGFGFLMVTALAGEFFDFEGTSFSALRPSTIALVMAISGVFGVFLSGNLNFLLVMFISFGTGIGIGLFVDKFVWQPLFRAQNTSIVSRDDLIGESAIVDALIPGDGVGRIIYLVNGSKVSSPAKSYQGDELAIGTSVKIERIDEHIFFVRRLQEKDEIKEILEQLEN